MIYGIVPGPTLLTTQMHILAPMLVSSFTAGSGSAVKLETSMMVGHAVVLNINRPKYDKPKIRLQVQGLSCIDHGLTPPRKRTPPKLLSTKVV